jgi:hypothetical protein
MRTRKKAAAKIWDLLRIPVNGKRMLETAVAQLLEGINIRCAFLYG